MELNEIPHLYKALRLCTEWERCMPNDMETKQMVAKLEMVLTRWAQTHREGTCCRWPRAQAVCRAVAQTGPTSHLKSECLVHRAGFSCTASPSSGLGHLQIHGCLKQETATQSGCYATDEGGSRAFLSSFRIVWICPNSQTRWESALKNQCNWSQYNSSTWRKYMWVKYVSAQGNECGYIWADGGKGNNSSPSCGWVNKGSHSMLHIFPSKLLPK